LLLGGTVASLLLGVAWALLRPAVRPYTPGDEAAASDEITSVRVRERPANAPEPRFADVAEELGVRFVHFHGKRSTALPEDMGSGAAWGDYDDDGDPDLYLVNESGPLTASAEEVARSPARSTLFRNHGGRFEDVGEESGVSLTGLGMGAAWGDFDGDGDLDLLVTRYGTNVLLRNDGNGRFSDVSHATGIDRDEGFWTGASWADFDRDGDLDLYVCGYVRYPRDTARSGAASEQSGAMVPYTLNPSSFPPERNLLLRNDRSVFREIGHEAGVDNPDGRSLSAAWADFDADGWPDLYVANDISDNAMYHNLGNGRFRDVSHAAWVADHRGAMGLAIGDWENDGDLDIHITHWIAQENALYENERGTFATSDAAPMRFVDQASTLGLGQSTIDFVGWGTEFMDYDNDGRLDLFVVNGSTFQREDDNAYLVPMRNQLFWNRGLKEGFFELGATSGGSFAVENVGRGAAAADYDGDGDLDLAVVVNGGPARLLRNDDASGHGWLRVLLRAAAAPPAGEGRTGVTRTTTFAVGARVRVTTGELVQLREVGSGPSYLSQSPPGEVFFGLGKAPRVDALEVVWPDGSAQTFRDLPARATVRLFEGDAIPKVSGP
jgi:hypothetical protein